MARSAPSGRPASSVNPDENFSLAEGFAMLIDELDGLKRVIEMQTEQNRTYQDAQQRFAMAGLNHPSSAAAGVGLMFNRYMPQINQTVLKSVAASGGMDVEHMTAGMTKVPSMAATSSLQSLRAFGAQQIGQWMSGMPLYGSSVAESEGNAPGQGGPGSTPVGTPTSTGVPATGAATGPVPTPSPGSGGAAAAAAAATAASTAASGPAGRLQGLPAMMWGGGAHAVGAPQGGMAQKAHVAMQQAGARLALSGGTSSGIMGAMRKLPILGLGIDAIDEGAQFYLNQREAGRQYQEVEGGSNLSAQTERFHAAVYGMSMFGRMPEGAAGAAFSDVTNLGYNQAATGQAGQQQNRQSALNFVYHNYTANGMDVNDSVKILQTASQNTAISLQQVSDVLTKLSDTAGKAGTSAETARQEFDSLMQAAVSGGAGQGAPGIAGAIAGAQASMGQLGTTMNYSGQLGSQMQYMLAGQYGLSPAETQDIERTNPKQYANMLSGSAMSFIQNYFEHDPAAWSDLKSMIQQAGGAKTPALQQQVAAQFLNKWQPRDNSFDENVMAQYFSSVTGIQMDANAVMPWIVSQVSGSGTTAANYKGTGTGNSVSASNTSGSATGQYGLALGSAGVTTGRAGALGAPGSAASSARSWQSVLMNAGGAAAQAYLTQEQKTRKRSPVLEALLQNVGQGDKVAVQTKNGPRVMSFADAMKYYPNELAAGQVEFYSKSGQVVGDTSSITHGLTDPTASIAAELGQAAGSKQGLALKKYEKAHPGTFGKGGNLTVGLSAEARQLLKLLPANNDEAAATSTPPASPYVTQGSR